jgi:hypothetical protein
MSINEKFTHMSNSGQVNCYIQEFHTGTKKGGTRKMGKLYRLINLMLIFIPLVTLAFITGFFGMILFEFQYWKATLFNE